MRLTVLCPPGGGPLNFLGDSRDNTRQVAIHLVVPESKNRKTAIAKPRVAPAIVLPTVVTAIHFHNQTQRQASEVDNVGADRDLPPKTNPELILA